MLFNSFPFLIFLVIAFVCYWTIGRKQVAAQNLLLVIASYVFYGWWDYRFLGLIVISSAVDFFVGKKIVESNMDSHKRKWLILSLIVNLGMLGFFKYFNFFISSFATLFGLDPSSFTLQVILPVGISFYTFQTLSYSIDVYRGKIQASDDPVAFFAFVAFFPQLVAGPIERAKKLLPQFKEYRVFEIDKATDGLRQMLWGFFKKIVVADNCAPIVDQIFAGHQEMSMIALWFGAILFSFQIYCDFSGYSDIAIGTARLFGMELSQNFAFPYFSRDLAEFWRRWHISLSTWFRDYLYIPLGGSRGSKAKVVRNVFMIFLVSGLWHGANWTFVVWGAVHAILFIPLILANKNRTNLTAVDKISDNLFVQGFRILFTFILVSLAWVFFRSPDLSSALSYLNGMLVSNGMIGLPSNTKVVFLSIVVLLGIEWIHRKKLHGLSVEKRPLMVRWGLYLGISMLIFFIGKMDSTSFIYFAF